MSTKWCGVLQSDAQLKSGAHYSKYGLQKQSSRSFLGKQSFEIMHIFIEQPCQSVISIKLLCSFIEIALRHGCSPVNLLHIFRIPFPTNTSGGLLLGMQKLSTCIIYAVYTSISENKLEFPFFQLKHTLKDHFW